MEFSLRYIAMDRKKVSISGDFRQEGEGNTIATGVGVLAVGLFAGFITGKRARLPTGRAAACGLETDKKHKKALEKRLAERMELESRLAAPARSEPPVRDCFKPISITYSGGYCSHERSKTGRWSASGYAVTWREL